MSWAQAVIDNGAVETVPGTQATPWNIGGALTVGQNGNGRLIIGDGVNPGVVTSGFGVLGQSLGSGGRVDIVGAGSSWDTGNNYIYVGGAGSGTLAMSNGGLLTTGLGGLRIGDGPPGIGDVLVSGTGTAIQAGGLSIGHAGQGSLTIYYDATVTSNGQITLGALASGRGRLTLTDGGKLDATGQDLILGNLGTAAMWIQSGGNVKTGTVSTALSAASTASVIVDGQGSSWQTGDLYFGYLGGSTLVVSNGGTITTGTAATGSDVYVGYGSSASTTNASNSVTVTGPGSTWTTHGALTIGHFADGQLKVTNGGAVVATDNAVIAARPGVTGIASVTGAGSSLTVGKALFVGGDNVNAGSGFLTIADGGTVSTGTVNGAAIVYVGMSGTTSAFLNIGDTMPALGGSLAAPGTLNAAEVFLGQFAQANFSHTSANYTFAPKFSGVGTIAVYNGTTTFTADSSAFGGQTIVGGGTLVINGKLGGTLDVLASGRLQGSGTMGSTVVAGTVAPGNSIGTLNIAGNVTFNAGSIYEVEVNAAGQSDRIVATGTATINGGSVKALAGTGNYAPATTYTILTANGGRTGTFTGGVTSNLAFLDPSLSYDAYNVYLTMTRNVVSFQNVGITPNQIAAGGGIESLGGGNAVYNAVLNLSAAQAQYAFDQLSGELHASARTALIEDSRFVRNAVNDRLRAAFDGVGATGRVTTYVDGKPVTVKANTDRLAVWGQGFGSWGHSSGDGNAARLNRSTGGFFLGADAPVFDTWRFGGVAGYSRTSFDVKDRHASGTSDNYHAGLYGGTSRGLSGGDLAFRTGAAYTWHDISTARNVTFPGFSNSLRGDYNAATAQLFGELAYGFNAGGARFEPFANLAYVNLHTDGFTEQGGAAALTAASATTDATFTTKGLRASTTINVGGATLTAKGMLGWRHAFGDMVPLSSMRFAGGGSTFSIGGVPIARDAAVIETGLDYAIAPNATLGVSYGGQFGAGMSDQSIKADFNVRF
ncbi:autotransporter domain-containing protein [Tardiphaga sp.]|uniref:autotransporter outer membrane beta-barrel domain-containing protein n=1 Tax=Tardiphaga sp. TaxID=1926292 RepID=UPI00352B3A3E